MKEVESRKHKSAAQLKAGKQILPSKILRKPSEFFLPF